MTSQPPMPSTFGQRLLSIPLFFIRLGLRQAVMLLIFVSFLARSFVCCVFSGVRWLLPGTIVFVLGLAILVSFSSLATLEPGCSIDHLPKDQAMAIVLQAFAPYVGGLIAKMTGDEVGMLLGVSGEIKKLESMLGDLENFHADAEGKRITNKAVAGWVKDLKNVMYDATDILDIYQLKADKRRAPGSSGCFDLSSFQFCIRDPRFAHKIGSRIKELNQKLEEISTRSERFKSLNLSCYEDQRPAASRNIRQTGPAIIMTDLVGRKVEQDTRMLVDMLTKEETTSRCDNADNTMVVAITGVGGIGKTTLAKRIYNDAMIQEKFEKKVWLSVTQEYDQIELVQTVITGLEGDHKGARNKGLLEQALMDAARGKKLFLVMDDIWSHEEWSELLRVPLNGVAPGSQILVTTRNEQVAGLVKATYIHRVNKLGPEDAWSLLKKQVALCENDEEKLKKIGMDIAVKCDCLPLAIKVIGGLLCKKDTNKGTWKQVLDDLVRDGMPEDLNRAVYLSYADLPSHLKQCFLHYSIIPKEDAKFVVSKVNRMWLAEGFIQEDGSQKHPQTVTMEYLDELVMRNLLEKHPTPFGLANFTMHDVVRSGAQHLSRDESFVVGREQNVSSLRSSKFRRLSICANEVKWSALHGQDSLRTLILYGNIIGKPSDSLNILSSLRVLHVNKGNFGISVDSLCHLKHLRYLDLSDTDISALPRDIGKMKLLQYIRLAHCKNMVQLPRSIVELRNLIDLNIADTKIKKTPKGFGKLENMKRVWGFPACILEDLGPLSQLENLRLDCLEAVSSVSMASRAKLCSKTRLGRLTLYCTRRPREADGRLKEDITNEEQQQIQDVFNELCPPPSVHRLSIGGYFGCQLPRWMMSTTLLQLENLTDLRLKDLPCCKELPTSLGGLPNLSHLYISDAPCIKRIGHELLVASSSSGSIKEETVSAITRRETAAGATTSGGTSTPSPFDAAFPKLWKLILDRVPELEVWDWEEQVAAMPVLQELEIEVCKLRRLPPGLAYNARDLRKLVIGNVRHLSTVENFLSVVELHLGFNPDLKKIANLPNMKWLKIVQCPMLEVLEGAPAVVSFRLKDSEMETLPGYLQDMNPRLLVIDCGLPLLESMSMGDAGSEGEKIRHIREVKVCANEGNMIRKWILFKYSCGIKTNVLIDRTCESSTARREEKGKAIIQEC